jgi:putative copper export protein
MISPTIDSLRIFLHVLAVAVWVGGQIVLAGIVPALRRSAPQSMPVVAQSFARIAWPAMVIVVFTGVWSLGSISVSEQSSAYLVTLGIKMLLVGLAIVATIIHSAGTSKASKAIGGAVGLLTSLLAAYAGILMSHVG